MAIIDRDSIWIKTTRPQPFQRISKVFSLAWSQGKTALAVVGAAVYAITRTSIDAFYARLGLTPEDVGLTEAKILGRATLYFAVIAAVFLLLLSISIMIVQWSFPTQNTLVQIFQLIFASILLIGVGKYGAIPYALKELDSDIYRYLASGDRPFLNFTAGQTIFAAELALYAALFYAFFIIWRGKTSGWSLVVVTIALTAFLASLPFPLANGHGRWIADVVVEKGLPLKRLNFALVDVRADPACVIWEQDPLKFSGYYLYLGSAGNKLTLYNTTERRAVRLPNDKANIIGFPEVTTIQDWPGYCRGRVAQAARNRAIATTTTTTHP